MRATVACNKRGFLLKNTTKPIQDRQNDRTANPKHSKWHQCSYQSCHNPSLCPSTAGDVTCRNILESSGKKISAKGNALLKTFSCQALLAQMWKLSDFPCHMLYIWDRQGRKSRYLVDSALIPAEPWPGRAMKAL